MMTPSPRNITFAFIGAAFSIALMYICPLPLTLPAARERGGKGKGRREGLERGEGEAFGGDTPQKVGFFFYFVLFYC